MCPGKEALVLILFSLFSNKQDTASGGEGLNRQMMNMQKLSQILVQKYVLWLLFLFLNTWCSSCTVTLTKILLEHNIHNIRQVFYHANRDAGSLYSLVESLHIKLH